jgi:peptide/nickel transport system substrate-binding protein
LGKYLRWQAVIALLGIVLLAALLRYAAFNFTTVTVPDRGGTYVEGVAGSPQFLNPLLSQYNQIDGLLVSLLFSGLTQLDEQGNVVPDLAESWTASPDGLTYDFRLRPGLLWHDGAPVTAADVLYTVQAMQADDFPGVPWLRTLWKAVKVEAPDGPTGLTVRFKLEQPLPSFLDFTTIGLLPAHLWERVPTAEMVNSQLNTRPVGTGPWQLAGLSATRADLTPNPRYIGEPPYLAGLSFRFYPDHQSLMPAYDRKEIDGISAIWPDEVSAAAKRKDLQLFSAPLSGYTVIYLNQANPNVAFFQDTAVRQALLYALDRQGLVDTVLQGQGVVAQSPFLPGTWGYDPAVPKQAYDPEKAKKLLDEAGWRDADGDGVREKDGKKLAFILVGDDRPLLDGIASAWAKVGVQAAVQPVTVSGLATDFLVPRSYDAAVVHWELAGDPDPYPLWHSTQMKDGQNYGGWNDRTTDQLIEKARAITDQAGRKSFYSEFQRIFASEVPAVLLYYPVYTYGVRDKIHGVQIGPLNEPHDRFRNIADWYIVTKRITVGNTNRDLTGTPESGIKQQ